MPSGSITESKMAPQIAVIILCLESQIQTVVGSEIAHKVSQLHDAFVAQTDAAESCEASFGDLFGIAVRSRQPARSNQPASDRVRHCFQAAPRAQLLVGMMQVVAQCAFGDP